ncbi:methylglyoxal synthase [Clostridium senegalense]|uniref:methylglyoxal synthase n=1 Tax=Clostridium senegalense TaxID=1465809 RepID=UPI000288EAE4|nr:methylglyoxal synthase [Clostridium senegalense]
MRIALIAHDKKKDEMIDFARRYRKILCRHELYATGTTGKFVGKLADLDINTFLTGTMGGGQQIGAKIAQGEIDVVFFFRDPLTAQPHEPDVNALIRLCDVHSVPLATNIGTAEAIIVAMKNK